MSTVGHLKRMSLQVLLHVQVMQSVKDIILCQDAVPWARMRFITMLNRVTPGSRGPCMQLHWPFLHTESADRLATDRGGRREA